MAARGQPVLQAHQGIPPPRQPTGPAPAGQCGEPIGPHGVGPIGDDGPPHLQRHLGVGLQGAVAVTQAQRRHRIGQQLHGPLSHGGRGAQVVASRQHHRRPVEAGQRGGQVERFADGVVRPQRTTQGPGGIRVDQGAVERQPVRRRGVAQLGEGQRRQQVEFVDQWPHQGASPAATGAGMEPGPGQSAVAACPGGDQCSGEPGSTALERRPGGDQDPGLVQPRVDQPTQPLAQLPVIGIPQPGADQRSLRQLVGRPEHR